MKDGLKLRKLLEYFSDILAQCFRVYLFDFVSKCLPPLVYKFLRSLSIPQARLVSFWLSDLVVLSVHLHNRNCALCIAFVPLHTFSRHLIISACRLSILVD